LCANAERWEATRPNLDSDPDPDLDPDITPTPTSTPTSTSTSTFGGELPALSSVHRRYPSATRCTFVPGTACE
jgi:hypothetical protein